MKQLNLDQMETLSGGDCEKSAAKVLIALGAATAAVLTGGLFAIVVGVASFVIATDDAVDNCETF